jgi:hypothetical protein
LPVSPLGAPQTLGPLHSRPAVAYKFVISCFEVLQASFPGGPGGTHRRDVGARGVAERGQGRQGGVHAARRAAQAPLRRRQVCSLKASTLERGGGGNVANRHVRVRRNAWPFIPASLCGLPSLPLPLSCRSCTPGDNRSTVMGLNLMFLLVENRLSEFHSEVVCCCGLLQPNSLLSMHVSCGSTLIVFAFLLA